MQYLANPTRFLKLANAVLPTVWVITLLLFAVGLSNDLGRLQGEGFGIR